MESIGLAGVVGVDLGDRHSYACAVDLRGNVRERFRLRTTKAGFTASFASRPPLRIVIETGTHSPWVSRLLEACGHEVVVANARRVSLISENNKKTDRQDCELLARLGRADPDLLAPIRHRGEECQQDLAVMRARAAIVRSRTLLINSVRGLVKSSGEQLPKCSSQTFHKVAPKHIPARLQPATDSLLKAIEGLTQAVKDYDEQIEALSLRYPAVKHIQAVAGVGPLCSLAFVLTIEDPHRFRRSRQVGAYLGLVPRLDDSGNSTPQLRITKAGDVDLRSLLVTSAQFILGPWGPDSDLRRWGLSMTERGGKNSKKRAVVAVARRLACLLHHLWRTGEVYDPLYLAKLRGEVNDPSKARPPRARKARKEEEELVAL